MIKIQTALFTCAFNIALMNVIYVKHFSKPTPQLGVHHYTNDTDIMHENIQAPSLPPITKHAKIPTKPDLLLSVPFYIYEDEFLKSGSVWNITEIYEFDVEFGVEVNKGEHFKNNGTKTFMEYAEIFKYWQQHGDVHFIRSALQHPMRVLNPEDAKLFVVPTLLTPTIMRVIYEPESALSAKARKHLLKANEVLRASPWFQRSDGADHIAPIAMWKTDNTITEFFELLTRCNVVQFHEASIENAVQSNFIHPDYQKNRTMYKIFYVGSPCKPVTSFADKNKDYAFIGNMNRPQRNFRLQQRRNACEWMTRSTNYSYSVCGRGDKCPHLSQALLGLHSKGDSYGANRLFDTLLSGTVPVFTMKEQYLTQSDFYDWDMISYFANIENKTEFLDHMNKNLSNKTDIMVKTKNVLENRDLFNWQTLVPFDIYMYHLQVKVHPEIPLVNSSKYSALILPHDRPNN